MISNFILYLNIYHVFNYTKCLATRVTWELLKAYLGSPQDFSYFPRKKLSSAYFEPVNTTSSQICLTSLK